MNFEEKKLEMDDDPFIFIHDLEEIKVPELDEKHNEAVSLLNPNKDDDRRLFQKRKDAFV